MISIDFAKYLLQFVQFIVITIMSTKKDEFDYKLFVVDCYREKPEDFRSVPREVEEEIEHVIREIIEEEEQPTKRSRPRPRK